MVPPFGIPGSYLFCLCVLFHRHIVQIGIMSSYGLVDIGHLNSGLVMVLGYRAVVNRQSDKVTILGIFLTKKSPVILSSYGSILVSA